MTTQILQSVACMRPNNSPISPLLDDSVKEGVPSVQVGVEPSTEVGGVQANPLEWVLEWPAPELPDSTLSDDFDLVSERDSNFMFVILKLFKHIYKLDPVILSSYSALLLIYLN